MAYPRADCPRCKRDVAVAPRKSTLWRHDPPERDPELKSCPGSHKFYQLDPERYDPERYGRQDELFAL